jgi:hypothetical protein
MTNEQSSYVEKIELDKGWTLSILKHSDSLGGFTYIISGEYSPEYQQAQNFNGGRSWGQPEVTRYPYQEEAQASGLRLYELLKSNPGYPYPDKMEPHSRS